MVNPKVKLLLGIGVIAAMASMIFSFAAGSHFQISSINGVSNYDFRVGAGGGGAAGFLGLIALAAFLGGIGLHLSRPGDGTRDSAPGPNVADTNGFTELGTMLRRVTKSRTDICVGGVCGGLGEHTPLPAWVWRALFLFFLFCYGVGAPLYICLWICLPQPDDGDASPNPSRATPYGTK